MLKMKESWSLILKRPLNNEANYSNVDPEIEASFRLERHVFLDWSVLSRLNNPISTFSILEDLTLPLQR